MKSFTAASVVFAALAAAQPHAHLHGRAHQVDKRELYTETQWVTVFETVTAVVGDHTTEYIRPVVATSAPAASSSVDAQFWEKHRSNYNQDTTASYVAPTTTAAPVYESVVTSITSTPEAPVVTPTTLTSVVKQPDTTTTAAAGPTTTATTPGGSGTVGDLTYYTIGLGSCGEDDSGKDDSISIVALSIDLMGTAKSYCGKTITISANGVTTTAIVKDTCMGCAASAIDGSTKVFKDVFGSLTAGRSQVTWWFN